VTAGTYYRTHYTKKKKRKVPPKKPTKEEAERSQKEHGFQFEKNQTPIKAEYKRQAIAYGEYGKKE